MVPKYLFHDIEKDRRFLITEYLPRSLQLHIKDPKLLEKDQVIKKFALEMLKAVEQIHKTKFIHGNITLDKFRVKEEKLLIVGFEKCEEYI